MGVSTGEMKGIKTNVTIKEAADVAITLVEKETPAGVIVSEKRNRPEHPKDTEIPIYLIQQAKKGAKDISVRMYLTGPPAEVEKDVYYPCVELRMTQDTMDNMDYVPDWKPFDLLDTEGVALRDEFGRQSRGYFYIVWEIVECTEEEDGRFFPLEPVKGEDIIAGTGLGGGSKGSIRKGASRRRSAQDVPRRSAP